MANSRIDFKDTKKKQKRSKIFKFIGFTFFALFIVAGAAVGYFVNKMANLAESAQHDLDRGAHSEKRDRAVNPSKDNFSVLFLGLDDRDGSLKGRTDALLLATFNKNERTIKMVNVPRDARVEIPGRDRMDKINHAHAFGGLDLTIDTVENLFDIPVDYFVKLNFDAFLEIVDALGGIEVDVPFTFSEMNSKDRKGSITIHEGIQTLNGEEALAFARMRKSDPRGDLGRGDRQKQIIEAIIRKGATFSSITKFEDVMNGVESNLSTNFSFGNMLSLHNYSSSLNNIESLTIKGDNLTLNRIYYYELNPESLAEVSSTLRIHLGLEAPPQTVDSTLSIDTMGN
ncbi:LCP family protein [Anaerobacillus sp. CMMVII]|uniref:LCP family glycopolymer transferase n=1 Tax=Anaerobacillus sp. CMMVII TaxID=2755588 RepID=UPI0021B831DF|nr:LCP family protein [Anaerobacillus sp. CMMVII]MCT8140337.1 LCP family protein [Anaerobacillus sp. CMMVII]